MKEKETVIRKAELKDKEEICEIQKRVIKEKCSENYTSEQVEALLLVSSKIKWVETSIDSEIDYFYVAERNNRVVGFGVLFMNLQYHRLENTEPISSLQNICINPDYSGQGVGHSLLLFLENIAKENKCSVIYVSALFNCVHFLQKMGYQVKEKSFIFNRRGIVVECFGMEKLL